MTNLVNYYDELALDRDMSAEDVRRTLSELILQHRAKASRPGSDLERFQRQIALAEQAMESFADEDAKERYDLSLVRLPKGEVDATEIDWRSRAWNYYFTGDNGAAMVAARKAKEQAPQDVMPYVISGWVHLYDKEFRLAKQDADEAYVLDEDGTDGVDVQMVRGTVYHFLENYERAIMSFDRVLPKAALAERSELNWRKSLSLLALERFPEAQEAALEGLRESEHVPETLRHGLEEAYVDSVHKAALLPADEARSLYQAARAEVGDAEMPEVSRQVLLATLTENVDRLSRFVELVDRQQALERVERPGGRAPGFPLVALVTALVLLVLAIGSLTNRSQAGLILLLLAGAIGTYIAQRIRSRSDFARAAENYVQAERELKEIDEELDQGALLTVIPIAR